MPRLDEGLVELLKAVAPVAASGEERPGGRERKQGNSTGSDVVCVLAAPSRWGPNQVVPPANPFAPVMASVVKQGVLFTREKALAEDNTTGHAASRLFLHRHTI